MPAEGTKEATILESSEQLDKMLDDLRARLDNRFSRNPKPTAEGEAKALQADNVLDEIIGNLARDEAKLDSIMDFISGKVLPKIS